MSNLPQRVGNYRLEKKIGKGGSSEVWLARHRLLDSRQVAIKLLLSQDPEWIERFSREASITARLRHEHIIQIFDHGEQPPFHYTIMEYVAGGALRDALKDGRRLPIELVLHIFSAAGKALDYAHAHGVVHRDVSPGNILLEPDSKRVLLTDFGIARESGKSVVTQINRVMGTPGYLSPEHASSATAVTHLSDIYSLGIVLFEMLSGRLPWDYNPGIPNDSGGPFAAPRTLRSAGAEGLPGDTDRIIQTMLQLDPSKRYPTAQAAIDDLDRVLKRHTNTTTVVPKGSDGKPAAKQKPVAKGGAAVPVGEQDLHPLEVILGPDLLKGPLEEARRRAEAMTPAAIAQLLDGWSRAGRFRRRLLGRQAAIQQITSTKSYSYTLRLLFETREPIQNVEEPYDRANQPPIEKIVDRWGVELPQPKGFVDEPGGSVRLPGSSQVVACSGCNGLGRKPCPRCQGKRLVPQPAEPAKAGASTRQATSNQAATNTTTVQPTAGALASSAAIPAATPLMVPCPDCAGTGAQRCERCQGAGALMQKKTVTWRRRAATYEAHDELPIDEQQQRKLLAGCKPVEVYRETSRNGFRNEWQQVPVLSDLIDKAGQGVDDNTRILLAELVVAFIPITEIVFDLGDQAKPVKPAQGQPPEALAAPLAQTYRWHIYGFENRLPSDWRFLNWSRVGVVLLSGLSLVLAVLLMLAIVV